MPITRYPSFKKTFAIEQTTVFIPGAGPPEQRIAIERLFFMFFSSSIIIQQNGAILLN
jgi:hypothetical protein